MRTQANTIPAHASTSQYIPAQLWNRLLRIARRYAYDTYITGHAPLSLFGADVRPARTIVAKGLKANDLRAGASLPRRATLWRKPLNAGPKTALRRKRAETPVTKICDQPPSNKNGHQNPNIGKRLFSRPRSLFRGANGTQSWAAKNRRDLHPCWAEPAGRFCSAQKFERSSGPKAQPFIERRAKPW